MSVLLFMAKVSFSILVVALQQLQVRIRRSKIDKLACQTKSVRIFAHRANTLSLSLQINFDRTKT